jgi:hypothetical protein
MRLENTIVKIANPIATTTKMAIGMYGESMAAGWGRKAVGFITRDLRGVKNRK